MWITLQHYKLQTKTTSTWMNEQKLIKAEKVFIPGQQFRNLGTFHTKTTSHVLGARSHAWKSIESSFQSLFDFSYTCTLVPSVNRPIAFLRVISRCRRRSRCFITTAISSLMFGSMATKTKKPLNLKLPVSLRSRKHFAMKESMQQLIVQFIGNRKIRTRWNATKVSRKCITGTAQGVGRFFGWFNFFFSLWLPIRFVT